MVGGPCDDGRGTCRALDGAMRLCVPDDSLICCDTDADCPIAGAMVGTCLGSALPTAGLCVDPRTNYCSGAARPTLAQVRPCHQDVDGNPVLWANGDCDGDGLTNAEEEGLGTDPCVRPPPRAVWTDVGCVELVDAEACMPGDDCDTDPVESTCARSSDRTGTECYPDDERLYCGDGEWVCPDGTDEVRDSTRGHTWCVPRICVGSGLDRAFCVIDGLGEPVPVEQGDCDQDGTKNGSDPEPCRRPDADAGTPPPGDAGSGTNLDAGPDDEDDGGPGTPMDGGTTSGDDAGETPPNVPVQFGGGGGCRCRASAASPTAPWPLALLGLWISLRAARRAHRTRRGGRARRSRR